VWRARTALFGKATPTTEAHISSFAQILYNTDSHPPPCLGVSLFTSLPPSIRVAAHRSLKIRIKYIADRTANAEYASTRRRSMK
jgi:hypothetical protein